MSEVIEVTTCILNQAGSFEEEENHEQEQEARRKKWREYYALHKEMLRMRARERAASAKLVLSWQFRAKQRRLESETPEQAEERRSRHREVAAKYREANRAKIRVRAWERRWYQYVGEIRRSRVRILTAAQTPSLPEP
ncbi:hypothetical protein CVT26_008493 [Gymnopilus dilepis]|uniref:Uncharacterized protein n=1 Tax=Gymnopilus dilepis TaxID=231916 RepID=A0A409YRX4_9AGAR|nr:hypothetical protein CVT26_008493 [Gymnopilus dilepis]